VREKSKKIEQFYENYKCLNFKNLDIKKVLEVYKQFQGFEACGDKELIIQIASLFYNIFRQKTETKEIFEKLIELVLPIHEELKDYNRQGICYQDLSIIKRLQGNYELSFDYIVKSVECFTKFGEPIRISTALNSLGNFYLDTGELNHALENYYKAYENIKVFNEHDAYFKIKGNLANIYQSLNYFSKAKELYIQDLDRLKTNELFDRYGKVLLGISQIYKEEKRTKLAFKYAKQSVDSYEKSDDQVGYATAISTLGSIYGDFEKYEEAMAHYKKAKEILEKIQYKLELLKLHNMMGETYLKMGDTNQAIENLELAKAMALEIKQNFELRKIYDNLYKAYDSNKEKLKAYEILKELTELNSNLFNFSLQAKVNEVQVNFELEKKELEYTKEREINEYKNNLFSYLTHEFRTPLTLINTPLEMLRNETNIDVIRTRMTNVSTHVQHMQHLLNQLLDINKIEEGKMPVMKKAGTINPLLWHMIHLFEPEMHDKDINFTYHLPKQTIQGYFDTDKIEKIISNLLSNALKFTQNGGNIEFNADIDHDVLTMVIKDNGLGIAPEYQEHVFDKFYRIPTTKDVKGSGLGLSFVKELVSLLHGEIKLESEQNKGSKFKITLPIERIEKLKKGEKTTQKSDSTASTKKNSILIVEDNLEIQKLLREVLQETYKVYTADHGRDAIAKIKKHIPDIVLSDIMMPLMNGIELCNFIKQDENLNHTPVILLTAKTQVNDKLLGLESGADAYITKPFNIEELSKTIGNMLEQRKKILDKFSSNILKLSDEDLVSSDHVFLHQAKEFILNHLENENLSVNDLAKHLNVSRFTLIRRFKKINNSTPNFYIQKIRLEKAKELIKNKVANVTEIAFKVGFSSTTYFSYSFKKEFGFTPKEYFNQSEKS
jgi:signal transduction histidine kinase/DNA-binding response OmpR family regulator